MRTRTAHCLLMLFLTTVTLLAQKKPDLTGSWELSFLEENGHRFPPRTGYKETQVWVQRESSLNIKMLIFNNGYFSLDLAYLIGGKNTQVGSKVLANGNKEPVNGKAYWVGDRLVYEQELPNAEKGHLGRIVRSVHLEKDGAEMVADQTQWMVGSDRKVQQTSYWQKKKDLP